MITNQLEAEADSCLKKASYSKVPVMKITRMPSVRFRRNLLRKFSGGTDLKKQLKKSRSIKTPSLGSSRSSNREMSSHQSESGSRENSIRVLRRASTLRPVRVLSSKIGSLRSKRPSIQKATCSSTLKDSKFPDDLETQPEENASEVAALAKVCSYSYCSLHGHRHASPPPLRRLISVRRRALKNQKGLKPEAQLSAKGGKPGVRKKEIQTRNMNITMQEFKDDAVSNLHDMETSSFSSGSVVPTEIRSDSSSVGGAAVQPAASDEEKNGTSEADHMLAVGNTEASTIGMENHSNFKFWNLVYRHMVTGLAAEDEKQPPLDGLNAEELGKNQRGIRDTSELGSCQDFSGKDHEIKMEGYNEGNQKLELTQSDALKLVQQAFNKLLSEIPDDSSDDQSIAGETISDDKILLEKRNEDEAINISVSPDSAQYKEPQDPGHPLHRVDCCDTAELPVKQVSEKQMPTRWSNLKKLIILKRFVKELESVRNFNRQKGQNLPMQHSPEAERVHLRCQMIEGRRSAEEWMLDYALQQVISTLAPSQRRKVDLLVQAFETVIPGMNTSRLSPAGSPHRAPVEATESSTQNANEGTEVNHSEILHGKTEAPKTGFRNHLDQVSDSIAQSTPESPLPKGSNPQFGSVDSSIFVLNRGTTDTDLKKEEAGSLDDAGNENDDSTRYIDDQLHSSNLSSPKLEARKPCNTDSTLEDEAESTSNKQVPENEALPEVYSSDSGLNNNQDYKDTPNETEEQQRKPDNPIEIMPGDGKPEYDLFQRPPPVEKSEFYFITNVAEGNKLEKQRYTRLWYLIYKHMVSTSAEEKQHQLLGEEAYKEEGGDGISSLTEVGNTDPLLNSSAADHDTMLKNHSVDHQNMELQSEVIKLVEEAIDEIPLSETQDDQEVPEKEPPEKSHIKGEEQFISIPQTSVKDIAEEPNKREEGHTTAVLGSENNGTQKDVTGVSNVANQYKSQGQKNWSNLKKLILIRRFVKSLEKVKAFNLRRPRFLPEGFSPEPEKVHLRRQDMEERKTSDGWMLDYALQQVVAKLTPARKRRVELLVEAFETVVPTFGN